MGHADGLSEPGSSSNHLIAYPESVLDVEDEEEQILYVASFEELAGNHVKYDTIIWVSISLLLVLAWGIGIILLLCLPIRRCLLQKDISSRKLYVTANEIVYKFSRPSILFWRVTTIEKRTPLSSVIDIIIEQGCLQSVYGLHTVRVESIAHGKAAPVDELQVQGVADPGVLRKVIITEASKNAQDFGKGCKPTLTGEEQRLSRGGSLSEGPVIFKSPSKSWKITGSPRYTSLEHRGLIQGEVLLNKLEEVSKSVKKIESLIKKSQASPESR
ncbi:hypothetical protein BDE02_14G064200 [Populus trichocarpa]|nr:hypothetical protein BDE02_14G064200 [Populus trichocarpa]KAI5564506.1 hypothetical protein BDE02_14G064200 [Populus trichocarpa]KAI5564507.1 hypothetical protein BDE02_14G064200 [Populus trichocarpa]